MTVKSFKIESHSHYFINLLKSNRDYLLDFLKSAVKNRGLKSHRVIIFYLFLNTCVCINYFNKTSLSKITNYTQFLLAFINKVYLLKSIQSCMV